MFPDNSKITTDERSFTFRLYDSVENFPRPYDAVINSRESDCNVVCGNHRTCVRWDLRELNLKSTQVEETDLVKFKAALPKCKIEWSHYTPPK